MVNVNLFGGPGCGKSTIAAGLFYLMKRNYISCELVSEYAKSLTYSKDTFKLKDQLYILAKSQHPWFKLKDQVDFTINDGPFPIGLMYATGENGFPIKEYTDFTMALFNSYENINFLIKKGKFKYQDYGRNQTESEADEISERTEQMLIDNNIPYFTLVSNSFTVDSIYIELSDKYPELVYRNLDS